MITPPEDDPQLPSYFAGLSVASLPPAAPPHVSSDPTPPYRLPYVLPDAYLNAETIAAAFQQFVYEASMVPAYTHFAIAFEHVVMTIRTAYVDAMGAAKFAEELGNDRLRRVEEHYREKSEKAKENQQEKKKLVALQHEAELALTKATHEVELARTKANYESEKQSAHRNYETEKQSALEEAVKLTMQQHNTEKQNLLEKHDSEKQNLLEKYDTEKQGLVEKYDTEKRTILAKHEAEIERSKMELNLTTKSLMTEIESAKRQTKALREEMSLARHRYIASNLELGSILHGYVTRRQSWQEAIKHGLKDETLPILSPENQITDADVRALVRTTFSDEGQMYAPTTQLLGKLLGRPRTESDQGVKVFNTHNRTVVPPFKPDLCICLDDSVKAESASVYVAIELKHISKTIDDDAYGQALDDLLVMHKHQPARCVLASLVSDLHINHIILLRIINDRKQQVVHYKTVSLAIALTYIKQVLLLESAYRPPVPTFSIQLSLMDGRLGNPKNSVVAEFRMPKNVLANIKSRWSSEVAMLGTTMAVKVLVKNITPASATLDTERIGHVDPDHSQELMIYHLIQSKEPCPFIARLVYESDDGAELGIAPVGKSVDLRGISDHFTMQRILTDVLEGIIWLHSHGIMHRDIRRDNIIVISENIEGRSRLRGKIIDFGAAIAREPGETYYREQDYVGGYICCPIELIGGIRRLYTPEPAHDLLAWVMLVNFLVFPNGVPYLHSQLVAKPSAEADKSKQYWHRLMASDVWGPLVRQAQTGKPDGLESMMSDVIVML